MFEWDDDKRLLNLSKHGIDFADAERIFAGFTLTAEDRSDDYREQHFLTLGLRNMKRASTSRNSRTDLSRLRRRKDAAIVRDADAPQWSPEMFARAVARKGLKPVARKTLLSLRVDADVLGWFRSLGPGYQSRMNALLRAYMGAHK
jgi:uncharacterized protein (DUF4415 family)